MLVDAQRCTLTRQHMRTSYTSSLAHYIRRKRWYAVHCSNIYCYIRTHERLLAAAMLNHKQPPTPRTTTATPHNAASRIRAFLVCLVVGGGAASSRLGSLSSWSVGVHNMHNRMLLEFIECRHYLTASTSFCYHCCDCLFENI